MRCPLSDPPPGQMRTGQLWCRGGAEPVLIQVRIAAGECPLGKFSGPDAPLPPVDPAVRVAVAAQAGAMGKPCCQGDQAQAAGQVKEFSGE